MASSSAAFMHTGFRWNQRATVGPQSTEKLFDIRYELERKDDRHNGNHIRRRQWLLLPVEVEASRFGAEAEERLELTPMKRDNKQDRH